MNNFPGTETVPAYAKGEMLEIVVADGEKNLHENHAVPVTDMSNVSKNVGDKT